MIGRALTNPGGAVVIIADTDHLDPTSIAAFASDTNTDPTDHDHEHDHEHDQHDPSHHEHEPADSDNESIATQPQFARELLGDLVSSFDPSRRYLLWSNCKAETIESLGLGVIDGANSLSKLINQNPRCRIIRVAQLATPPTH
jgi:ABC-type Zn2+ transport system substrate-binding protein/surface adhesin